MITTDYVATNERTLGVIDANMTTLNRLSQLIQECRDEYLDYKRFISAEANLLTPDLMEQRSFIGNLLLDIQRTAEKLI